MLSRTPDWIANRGVGTESGVDQEAFRSAVIDALTKNVALEPD